MTLHDPTVQSGLFAAVGVAGFLASVANLTHAVNPDSPERPENKVRHFWAAAYFGWIVAAYFRDWGSPPAPATVWLSLCGAGWAWTHAAKLGRLYFNPRRRRRDPELPLFRRRVCCWLIVGLSAGIPLVAASLPGCSVGPAYSPQEKAVVLAERALKANFESIDSFLAFDDENRAWMRMRLPEVHAFAERLRRPGPDGVQAVVAAQRAAWRAHDAWAKAPTAENAARFDVAAEQVRAWAQQARKWLETTR